MKTKLFAVAAVFIFMSTSVHAGGFRISGSVGGISFAGGSGYYRGGSAYCSPVVRNCYAGTYYSPYAGYWNNPWYSWGPQMVYYSTDPANQVSSIFSNGASVPVYKVPPPVTIAPTQPVTVYPTTFGWRQ